MGLQRPVWECRVELVRKKKSTEVDRPTLESDRNKLDCYRIGIGATKYWVTQIFAPKPTGWVWIIHDGTGVLNGNYNAVVTH